MASFWFLLVLCLLFVAPSLASDDHDHHNAETSSTISASPAALLSNPPQSLPPSQELSPDISPLLPSPGGVLPAPATSSIPTIPANPSPPNPDDDDDDEFLAPGPDSAFAPSGSLLPGSSMSMAPASLLQPFNLLAVCVAAAVALCSMFHQLLGSKIQLL